MKTLLWFAAAAGALAVARLILDGVASKQATWLHRAVPVGPSEFLDVTVIEIVPLDVPGPVIGDTATIKLLDELVNESLFLK
jgi:hypothetical protein